MLRFHAASFIEKAFFRAGEAQARPARQGDVATDVPRAGEDFEMRLRPRWHPITCESIHQVLLATEYGDQVAPIGGVANAAK
jgi:hypothetical protein